MEVLWQVPWYMSSVGLVAVVVSMPTSCAMAISLCTRILSHAFPPEKVHLDHSSSPTFRQAIKTQGLPQGPSPVHQQEPGLVFAIYMVYTLVVCWQCPWFVFQ
jgi:hypothetical protein